MPRHAKTTPGTRQYGTKTRYKAEDLQAALNAVKSGSLSQRQAASQYKIPRSTLKNKLKHVHIKTVGRPPVLSDEEEKMFQEHVISLSELGLAITMYDLRCIVKSYLDKSNRRVERFKNNMPGWDWAESFLKRHPDLKATFGHNIKRNRAQVDSSVIDIYFDNLEKELDGVPPGNIYNFDETGCHDSPKKKKLLFRRSNRNPEVVRNATKSCYTAIFCGSATGEVLPPYFVIKGKKKMSQWMIDAPRGSRLNVSKSGWVDTEVFEDWFHELLLPHLQKKDGRKVVIGDNLTAHVSTKVLKTCSENNISFVFLPPNSTNLLQPLDVCFYSPLKSQWRAVLNRWRDTPQGKSKLSLPVNVFVALMKRTLSGMSEGVLSKNIISGFKATGIFPLSRHHVLEKLPAYAQSQETRVLSDIIGGEFKSYLNSLRDNDLVVTRRGANFQLPVEPGKSVSHEEVMQYITARQSSKMSKNKQQKPGTKEATKPAKPKGPERKKRELDKTEEEVENSSSNDIEKKTKNLKPGRPRCQGKKKRRRLQESDDTEEESELEYPPSDNDASEGSDDVDEPDRPTLNTLVGDYVVIDGVLQPDSGHVAETESAPRTLEIEENIVPKCDDSAGVEPTKYSEGDFVIIHYEGSYFPGSITDLSLYVSDKKIKVSAMVINGRNWKWPATKDEIIYSEEDVIKKIDPNFVFPVTSRGDFHIDDNFLKEKWNL